MNKIRTALKTLARAWRWRRAIIAAAFVAPLALVGGTDVLAMNALGLCWAAFAALRLVRAIRGR